MVFAKLSCHQSVKTRERKKSVQRSSKQPRCIIQRQTSIRIRPDHSLIGLLSASVNIKKRFEPTKKR